MQKLLTDPDLSSSQPVADLDRAFGGSQLGDRQKGLHLLKYPMFSATIELWISHRPGKWLFVLAELVYVIFYGKTTVRFTSLMHKAFEEGPEIGPHFSHITQLFSLVYLFLNSCWWKLPSQICVVKSAERYTRDWPRTRWWTVNTSLDQDGK